MTPTPSSSTPSFGTVGLWRGGGLLTPELAAGAEQLGYGTVWVGGSPSADLAGVEELLDATENITIATGIVNIWTAAAGEVAESFHRLEAKHPGRFVLGIGMGHRESTGDRFVKPFDALVSYLDELDAGGVPVQRRVIAALGKRSLKLAAERSAGTHPYMTTPEHTRYAREVMGQDAIIAPEQRLVWNENATESREIGRGFLKSYLALGNYRRTLERHGFTKAELDDGATDAAVDALAPHGAAAALAQVVRGQLDAGANHVCVQFLPRRDDPLPALSALATALKDDGLL